MTLTELQSRLQTLAQLRFWLPDGSAVPAHFHVTEVGLVERHFIDCGGTIRRDQKLNLQLWYSNDVEHRLAPARMLGILAKSVQALSLPDLEVEAEYQGETIGRYGLRPVEGGFQLVPLHTDCLAKEQCGVPTLAAVSSGESGCCTPGGGCC